MEDFSNFELSLKSLGRKFKGAEDLPERRQKLLDQLRVYSSSRFHFLRALVAYREGLSHGGWLPLIEVVAPMLQVTSRTLRQWISNYEKVSGTPLQVVRALEQQGVETTAARNLELVRGTAQALLRGLSIEQAVEEARALAPLHLPPPRVIHPLTPMEQWVADFVEGSIESLVKVPQGSKQEVIERATAELLWMARCTAAVTITPAEPAVDVSGRRRPACSERAPETEMKGTG